MRLQPHPFTLRQLQYLLAVAEHLNFRKAAEACHVSQPALSAQVNQVEELLGVALFERDPKRVLLTPAGTLLLPQIRKLVEDGDTLTEMARRTQDPLQSNLRIGVIPTIAPYLLPPLTPLLRAHFPKLMVYWTEGKTPDLVAALHAGELDAAILALEADLGDTEWASLGRDPFVLATPKEHPLHPPIPPDGGCLPPLTIEDLQPYPLLLLDEGHCLRTQTLAHCARADVREMAWRATSLPTLVQMVAAGAGLTLLPALAVAAETARANLGIRRFTEPGPFRTLILGWRAGSPLSTALRRLARTMAEATPSGS